MFYRRSRNIFLLVTISVLAGACGFPGLSPAPLPPTAGADDLATIIAATAAAAATGTQAALPPTPTETLTPTPTPFPTSTPTPAFSSQGTALLAGAADGAVRFVDQSAGYELSIPAGWLLVRVGEPEYVRAWALPEAADPKIQNFLRQVQKSDPAAFRLFGVDILPGRSQGGFVSNFNVFWDRSSSAPIADILETLEAVLPETSLDASVLTADLEFTSASVPIGIVETTSKKILPGGWPVHVYQKQVIYQLPAGALTIVLSTTDEMKDHYLPGFNVMVDGIIISSR